MMLRVVGRTSFLVEGCFWCWLVKAQGGGGRPRCWNRASDTCCCPVPVPPLCRYLPPLASGPTFGLFRSNVIPAARCALWASCHSRASRGPRWSRSTCGASATPAASMAASTRTNGISSSSSGRSRPSDCRTGGRRQRVHGGTFTTTTGQERREPRLAAAFVICLLRPWSPSRRAPVPAPEGCSPPLLPHLQAGQLVLEDTDHGRTAAHVGLAGGQLAGDCPGAFEHTQGL